MDFTMLLSIFHPRLTEKRHVVACLMKTWSMPTLLKFQINWLCVRTSLNILFKPKIWLENGSTFVLFIINFLIAQTFRVKWAFFSRNLSYHWNVRAPPSPPPKKKFYENFFIIFWKFTMFQYRSDTLQVKQNLISSIANFAYVLTQELPNNLRLSTFVN